MSVNLAIIGCCASRDWVFSQRRGAGRSLATRPHFHSSALAAQFLPPVSGPFEIDPALRAGDQAVVRRDLLRTWPSEMEALRPDAVLVDLSYEAVDGLVFWNGGWITRSVSIRQSPRMVATLPRALRPIDDPDGFAALVAPAYAGFAAFMAERLPKTRILLHRARFALHYRARFGQILPFPEQRQATSRRYNALAEGIEALFLKAVPKAEPFDLGQDLPVAELWHRWGLHPIHYEEAYYRRFLSLFRRTFGQQAGWGAVADGGLDRLSETRRRWKAGVKPVSDA